VGFICGEGIYPRSAAKQSSTHRKRFDFEVLGPLRSPTGRCGVPLNPLATIALPALSTCCHRQRLATCSIVSLLPIIIPAYPSPAIPPCYPHPASNPHPWVFDHNNSLHWGT
jgi:hypothetical protein